MKKTLSALMLVALVGFGTTPAFAAEPSLHEVYQAAEAGRIGDAQRMMREVLQAHPNSGKAHYVEAELLAKEGRTKQAADELATAEKLAPGLPFATAQSVSGLRALVSHPARMATPVQPAPLSQPAPAAGVPWGMLLAGLALIAFIVWATRFMASRNAQAGTRAAGLDGYRPASPASSYGGLPQSYGPPATTPAAGGAGLGSQMLGGLATGAALGAGAVAGGALMHHFLDGRSPASPSGQDFSMLESSPGSALQASNDMGSTDFGISDASSWDDSASSADSDWT